MTKVNLNNGSKTESDIFPWEIFKSDIISFFLSKYLKVFQCLSKPKFLSFMTKLNSNNGIETKSSIFPWGLFKSDIIFHWS